MSDTDQLSAELCALREQSTEVVVPAAPPLEAITADGRRFLRRRRFARAGLSVVGATAAAVLTLELTAAVGPASTTASHRTTAPTSVGSSAPKRIQTAAFTLISNSDGTVTLIIDPVELFEPTTLQDDLAQYGIAALVTTGKICTSDPAPAGISRVETYDPGTPADGATITIDPSAMPAGSELSFGTVDLKDDVQASYSSLIDPDAYTCTSTPPTDADPHVAREGVIRLTPTN